MKRYLEWLTQLDRFKELEKNAAAGKTVFCTGIYKEKAYIAASLIEKLNRRAFIIVPDEETARTIHTWMTGYKNDSCIFPPKDYNFRSIESTSHYIDNTRLDTLAHIVRNDKKAIIIPAQSLAGLVPCPEEFKELKLSVGDQVDLDSLKKDLINMGYESFSAVEAPGQFSIRGGIIDVFSPSEEAPFRIELFGDEIDTINIFDISTQRRYEQVKAIRISKSKESSLDSIKRILDVISSLRSNKYTDADRDLLSSGILPAHDRYIPLMFERPSSILDYITDDDLVFVFEYKECVNALDAAIFRINEDILALQEDGCVFPAEDYYIHKEITINRMKHPIFISGILHSINEFKLDALLDFKIKQTEFYSIRPFIEEAKELVEKGYEILAVVPDRNAADSLKQQAQGIPLIIETGSIISGFILDETKKAVFEFRQKEKVSLPRRTKYKRGETIHDISDIKKGDYVVHDDYGIGIYNGIVTLQNKGIYRDYIKIQYYGTDVVYVPCEMLNVISKYSSGEIENHTIHLSRLGSSEWKKQKSRVKKSIEDMAEKLIQLYGERLNIRGHAFSEDTDWQKNFEESFEFEETEDQIKAIAEIKEDMEKQKPMDRLLCGDVGYGKTEVAFRAIFKCVMDGKQAALLCPTTILALQHYQTMKERFKEYPIEIELLSRFKTKKQAEDIVSRLKKGKVDVLIGTHRITSKDVQFNDLGLIVIDEEQRFGVAKKEQLKELSKSADVLTISATPIPRTLNMSLSGIRDISILNDAPQNRYPVTTYIAEYDLGLVTDAIKKEVYRGGQVFYLYNRVDSIYKVANTIEKETGVRVAVAHGQMSKDQLADIWTDVLDGKIDVLVCTTIIETGVDVPNCNTLIVEDADRLGLAQMHQIRGRVGRTNKRAYAYFFYRKGKVLSEDSYKRLMAIKEFTEFGSGLKIAMRDLQIRGAGDILGAEQSGHIMTVGYDMYMKLLEEAVGEKKGLSFEKKNCVIDLKISGYIPESYIDSSDIRMEFYKAIASISSENEKLDIIDELIDRFGQPPKEVMNLFDVTQIRKLGIDCGITEISQKEDTVIFILDKEPDIEIISEIVKKLPSGSFYFSTGVKNYYSYKTGPAVAKNTLEFLNILKNIVSKPAN